MSKMSNSKSLRALDSKSTTLLFILLFAYLLGLSSPQFIIYGVPYTFILPALVTLIGFIFFSTISANVLDFCLIFILIMLSNAIVHLFSEEQWLWFSWKSLLLFLFSVLVFIIYASLLVKFWFLSQHYNLSKVSSLLILTAIIICFLEIIIPSVFTWLRSNIYSSGTIPEEMLRLRDENYMLGFPRPLWVFTEPSHLAKLLGFLWIIYAVSNNFGVVSLAVFFLIFAIVRSPTLFFVTPLWIFYIPLFFSGNALKRTFMLLLIILFSVITIFLLHERIINLLQNGEGSFQERYMYPFLHLYERYGLIGSYPVGGHQSLYFSVCKMMASTRPEWLCTLDSTVAANGALVLIGSVGALFIAIWFALCMIRFGVWGAYYITTLLITQFFLTGYNTPSTYIISAVVLATVMHLSSSRVKRFEAYRYV